MYPRKKPFDLILKGISGISKQNVDLLVNPPSLMQTEVAKIEQDVGQKSKSMVKCQLMVIGK